MNKQRNTQSSKYKCVIPKLPRTYQTSIHKGERPISEKWMQEIADDYMDYYLSPDRIKQRNGLVIDEFISYYRIGWDAYEGLIKKHEYMEIADKIVRGHIASRRQNGMIHKDYDYQSTHYLMRYLSPMWKQEQDRLETLKKELTDKSKGEPTTFNIFTGEPPEGAKVE
jgi:hypothetical protein